MVRRHEEGFFGDLEVVLMDEGAIRFEVGELGEHAHNPLLAENDEGVTDGSCDLPNSISVGQSNELTLLDHDLYVNNIKDAIVDK